MRKRGNPLDSAEPIVVSLTCIATAIVGEVVARIQVPLSSRTGVRSPESTCPTLTCNPTT
jgi:hypothetical protein